MIAIDTNILVFAHRRDSPHHERAFDKVAALAESGAPWCIPWPCIHEFIGIVTHSIYKPASTLQQAFAAIDVWTETGTLELIGEGPDHLQRLQALASAAKVIGPAIHDARIAAICLAHGVSEIWTFDRDFLRFPLLTVVNPIVR